MVMMSYWPPLVAMSVVTFWRSTFSSSVTQLQLDVGIGLGEVVRQLLHADHVAVVDGGDGQRDGLRAPGQRARQAAQAARSGANFMDVLPLTRRASAPFMGNYSSKVYSCQAGDTQSLTHVPHAARANRARNAWISAGYLAAEQARRGALVGDQTVNQVDGSVRRQRRAIFYRPWQVPQPLRSRARASARSRLGRW